MSLEFYLPFADLRCFSEVLALYLCQNLNFMKSENISVCTGPNKKVKHNIGNS